MTTAETANPKLARVRALLDTAESYAAEGNHEAAETYRNKAIQLMVTHGIDHAMAEGARKNPNEKPIQRAISCPAPYTRDKQYLLNAVAQGLGVKSVRIRGTEVSFVVGFEADVERVELLFTSLLLQAFSELAKVRPVDVIPTWSWLTPSEKRSARSAYNRSWLMGFASAVNVRLEEATKRARQDYETEHATSTALVLADRNAQVEVAYKDFFPNARTDSRRQLSGGGTGHGQAAGMRANLGTTGIGGQKRALTR